MNITEHLRALEEQLMDPNTRRDAEKLVALLAEDFREFGSSGRVFARKEVVEELAIEAIGVVTVTNFEVTFVAENVALATYTATRDTGKKQLTRSLRSSLWVFRKGRWQMLFHQGTRVPE
jgi:hypothetical protein